MVQLVLVVKNGELIGNIVRFVVNFTTEQRKVSVTVV
jgi:hypothetical protein